MGAREEEIYEEMDGWMDISSARDLFDLFVGISAEMFSPGFLYQEQRSLWLLFRIETPD